MFKNGCIGQYGHQCHWFIDHMLIFACDHAHRLTLRASEYKTIFGQINGWAVNAKRTLWMVLSPLRGPPSYCTLSVQPAFHRWSRWFAEVRLRQGGQAFLQPGSEGWYSRLFLSQMPLSVPSYLLNFHISVFYSFFYLVKKRFIQMTDGYSFKSYL